MTPLSDQVTPGFSPHRRPVADAVPPERVAGLARRFAEATATVCTSRLGRPVSAVVSGIEDTTPADPLSREPMPWVVGAVGYARGLAGTHHVVLGRASALALGHALAGGGGEALELRPAHLDAIREALDQVFGIAAASVGSAIGRSVGFGPAAVRAIEAPAGLPPELAAPLERSWLVRVALGGADEFRAELALTLGGELAGEIATAEPVAAAGSRGGIDLILDVTLPVAVELGRARMQIQDILKLAPGAIVELDKAAGDSVDILINDRPIAKGEVVVIDEHFGVRLTSIVTATERIRTLR